MLVGVPKEIKDNEYRAGMVPTSVVELIHHGHEVLVQSGLGLGIGVTDDDYRAAGATIIDTAADIFAKAEMIVKVKEPQPQEIAMLRKGQVLFTYLHLAPDLPQTRGLMESGVTAIAYETIYTPDGVLPLLAPMSEVAGRLAVQAGATCLEKDNGGAGILLGGVPGVDSAHVLIIGGGIVGENAAYIAKGMGAEVTILDNNVPRLRELDNNFAGRVHCVFSNKASIEKYATEADLVVGAVLVAGAAAPKLLTKNIISKMKPGSVVVDVAIDQGGCFETSRPTTHSDPTFVVDGVVHYCVANMPGVVPRTSSFGLNNATLPYILRLADEGWQQALADDEGFMGGLNIHAGHVCCEMVADAHDLVYSEPNQFLI
ncbi:MAG: alanine dehydrogenase [Gammaproteobacteria bacterium]|nr:alanine dehydrogenase [Gammaproteobacteria bacterium]